MCVKHDLCTCPPDANDTSDKDSPAGITLTYSHTISEAYFRLPYNEFLSWLDRQLEGMKVELYRKGRDAYIERETDKSFPTEFTRE